MPYESVGFWKRVFEFNLSSVIWAKILFLTDSSHNKEGNLGQLLPATYNREWNVSHVSNIYHCCDYTSFSWISMFVCAWMCHLVTNGAHLTNNTIQSELNYHNSTLLDTCVLTERAEPASVNSSCPCYGYINGAHVHFVPLITGRISWRCEKQKM